MSDLVEQWSRPALKLRSLSKFFISNTLLKVLQTVKNDGHERYAHRCVNPPPPMHSFDPTYPLYSVLSFLGFVVVLIPFSWHLQASNVGTCAYMFWVSFACLIEFVNSLVWAGNLDNNIPVWCDIGTCFPPLHNRSRSDLTFFFSNKVFARSWCWHRRFFAVYQPPPVYYCFNSDCF